MNAFSWPRFTRILCNDVLRVARPLGIATLAAMAIGLVLYLSNVEENTVGMYAVLYPLALLGGGLLFTSMSFSDMHHPLERFHYLTLPCSNLERFLSRYLLSAPLFLLYATAAYFLFELLARQAAVALWDEATVLFNPLDPLVREPMLHYFALHALVFAGAIHFRSHALIRTVIVLFGIALGIGLVFMLSLRIIYWDYFTSWFTLDSTAPLNMAFRNFWREYSGEFNRLAVVLGCLWVLYLGWLRLLDHEVQE